MKLQKQFENKGFYEAIKNFFNPHPSEAEKEIIFPFYVSAADELVKNAKSYYLKDLMEKQQVLTEVGKYMLINLIKRHYDKELPKLSSFLERNTLTVELKSLFSFEEDRGNKKIKIYQDDKVFCEFTAMNIRDILKDEGIDAPALLLILTDTDLEQIKLAYKVKNIKIFLKNINVGYSF